MRHWVMFVFSGWLLCGPGRVAAANPDEEAGEPSPVESGVEAPVEAAESAAEVEDASEIESDLPEVEDTSSAETDASIVEKEPEESGEPMASEPAVEPSAAEPSSMGAPETESAVPGASEDQVEATEQESMAPDTSERKPFPLRTWGQIRYIVGGVSDFAVDAEGTTLGQGVVAHQRFRVGVAGTLGNIEASTEWDLFTGQFAGDTWDIPGDADRRHREALTVLSQNSFLPRVAGVKWQADVFELFAGLTTSQWGLGMVANDGSGPAVFGRSDFGDRVIRLLATTQVRRGPGGDLTPLFLSGAFDLVVEDDVARLADGQQATQGVLSAVWADAASRRVGVYLVYRNQWERDEDRSTQAWVIDGHGDVPFSLGGGWRLRIAAEVAGIFGTTDRVVTYNATDGLTLSSLGATGLIEVVAPDERFGVMVRAGYASADGDPDDGASHDFTFDRDFDVGMVLFDDLMGGVEAATYNLLVDPQYSGQPPDGVDSVVTEGAFRRGVFLQPVVVAEPLTWLDCRAGVTFAWSSGPVTQPFYTYRAGGQPTNHLGAVSEGRWLGAEVGYGLGGGGELDIKGFVMSPRFEIQAAHLFPGKVIAGDASVLHRVDGYLTLEW